MRVILRSLLLLGFWNVAVHGYPMIVEVDEEEDRCVRYKDWLTNNSYNDEQCFNLNIPEDDDAHLLVLALPSESTPTADWVQKYEALEQYFLTQVIDLTKNRVHTALPRTFAAPIPQDIQNTMDELINQWYNGETNTFVQVKISNPHTLVSTNMETHWFRPLIINHVSKHLRERPHDAHEKPPLEGYEICFMSKNEDVPALMMVEHVLTSDDLYEESEDSANSKIFKGEHLTPLQNQLDESLQAAQSVIRELNLMERREKRMRQTADSINWRVRNFSYFSILVLILVTFFQVTYLKRYFKKKKLL
eukprot:scaffold4095_cov117-Cylindrotheca_fusiformis.AAC.18